MERFCGFQAGPRCFDISAARLSLTYVGDPFSGEGSYVRPADGPFAIGQAQLD